MAAVRIGRGSEHDHNSDELSTASAVPIVARAAKVMGNEGKLDVIVVITVVSGPELTYTCAVFAHAHTIRECTI